MTRRATCCRTCCVLLLVVALSGGVASGEGTGGGRSEESSPTLSSEHVSPLSPATGAPSSRPVAAASGAQSSLPVGGGPAPAATTQQPTEIEVKKKVPNALEDVGQPTTFELPADGQPGEPIVTNTQRSGTLTLTLDAFDATLGPGMKPTKLNRQLHPKTGDLLNLRVILQPDRTALRPPMTLVINTTFGSVENVLPLEACDVRNKLDYVKMTGVLSKGFGSNAVCDIKKTIEKGSRFHIDLQIVLLPSVPTTELPERLVAKAYGVDREGDMFGDATVKIRMPGALLKTIGDPFITHVDPELNQMVPGARVALYGKRMRAMPSRVMIGPHVGMVKDFDDSMAGLIIRNGTQSELLTEEDSVVVYNGGAGRNPNYRSRVLRDLRCPYDGSTAAAKRTVIDNVLKIQPTFDDGLFASAVCRDDPHGAATLMEVFCAHGGSAWAPRLFNISVNGTLQASANLLGLHVFLDGMQIVAKDDHRGTLYAGGAHNLTFIIPDHGPRYLPTSEIKPKVTSQAGVDVVRLYPSHYNYPIRFNKKHVKRPTTTKKKALVEDKDTDGSVRLHEFTTVIRTQSVMKDLEQEVSIRITLNVPRFHHVWEWDKSIPIVVPTLVVRTVRQQNFGVVIEMSCREKQALLHNPTVVVTIPDMGVALSHEALSPDEAPDADVACSMQEATHFGMVCRPTRTSDDGAVEGVWRVGFRVVAADKGVRLFSIAGSSGVDIVVTAQAENTRAPISEQIVLTPNGDARPGTAALPAHAHDSPQGVSGDDKDRTTLLCDNVDVRSDGSVGCKGAMLEGSSGGRGHSDDDFEVDDARSSPNGQSRGYVLKTSAASERLQRLVKACTDLLIVHALATFTAVMLSRKSSRAKLAASLPAEQPDEVFAVVFNVVPILWYAWEFRRAPLRIVAGTANTVGAIILFCAAYELAAHFAIHLPRGTSARVGAALLCVGGVASAIASRRTVQRIAKWMRRDGKRNQQGTPTSGSKPPGWRSLVWYRLGAAVPLLFFPVCVAVAYLALGVGLMHGLPSLSDYWRRVLWCVVVQASLGEAISFYYLPGNDAEAKMNKVRGLPLTSCAVMAVATAVGGLSSV